MTTPPTPDADGLLPLPSDNDLEQEIYAATRRFVPQDCYDAIRQLQRTYALACLKAQQERMEKQAVAQHLMGFHAGAAAATPAPTEPDGDPNYEQRQWASELIRLIQSHDTFRKGTSSANEAWARILRHIDCMGKHWRARTFLAERAAPAPQPAEYINGLIDRLLMPPPASTEKALRKLHEEAAAMLHSLKQRLATPAPQADDESDMLTIAYMSGFHAGKKAAPQAEDARLSDMTHRMHLALEALVDDNIREAAAILRAAIRAAMGGKP